MNLDKMFESAREEIQERAYDTSGMSRVVVYDKNNQKEYSYTFDANYKNFNDVKNNEKLKEKMKKNFGYDVVNKIVAMMVNVNNKQKNFKDNNTDIVVDGKEVRLIKKGDDTKKKPVITEGKTMEFDGKTWTGELATSPTIKPLIHKYLHTKYGLDKVSLNTNGDDITYDQAKGKFIINFEKPHMVNGKKMMQTMVSLQDLKDQ
jgi:hypothetical protein